MQDCMFLLSLTFAFRSSINNLCIAKYTVIHNIRNYHQTQRLLQLRSLKHYAAIYIRCITLTIALHRCTRSTGTHQTFPIGLETFS
jgi:hypothetical protein